MGGTYVYLRHGQGAYVPPGHLVFQCSAHYMAPRPDICKESEIFFSKLKSRVEDDLRFLAGGKVARVRCALLMTIGSVTLLFLLSLTSKS